MTISTPSPEPTQPRAITDRLARATLSRAIGPDDAPQQRRQAPVDQQAPADQQSAPDIPGNAPRPTRTTPTR
ncbi:hypothetical protein [Parafrankia elaeagni]|uniref:hypothetical protein n=1 Tax=Parafrankia elaeagni TaxID=222534 RepID=UPI0012B6212D|nr:hypothetical protein [Parafrankia elaeagni]